MRSIRAGRDEGSGGCKTTGVEDEGVCWIYV